MCAGGNYVEADAGRSEELPAGGVYMWPATTPGCVCLGRSSTAGGYVMPSRVVAAARAKTAPHQHRAAAQARTMAPIPITIITGFLGSGKTSE